jgi:hypothetical protein
MRKIFLDQVLIEGGNIVGVKNDLEVRWLKYILR